MLVERAKTGDRTAFVALYRRHAPPVARRLRHLLGNKTDAEDVLQVTFLEVHRSLRRYDPARPFAAWLHGIALNVTRRFLRTQSRHGWQSLTPFQSLDAVQDSITPTAEQAAMTQDLAHRLYRAMERLAPGMRIAFTLHEIEGLGLTEIAHQVGTTPQAVGAQVERARKHIERRLSDFSTTAIAGGRS
ncbi:MAG: sigma-70 family RNA polymerase sigma factor [Myxococcota bacterium]